jgi:hypothetical protein
MEKRQIGHEITIKLTTDVLIDKWDVEIRMEGTIGNGELITSFARTAAIDVFRSIENPELLVELAMRALWGNVAHLLKEKLIDFGVLPYKLEQLPEIEDRIRHLQKRKHE